MAPRLQSHVKCQVCSQTESKYICPACSLRYCSASCFKAHKAASCASTSTSQRTNDPTPTTPERPQPTNPSPSDSLIQQEALPNSANVLLEPAELRPLTSLRWPYIPDESSYPDPLKRNDPKTLQLHQYEAIATSPAIRKVLAQNPRLRTLLISLDNLRGPARERELQRALGVNPTTTTTTGPVQFRRNDGGSDPLSGVNDEDLVAFRRLAEAIEQAVRSPSTKQSGPGTTVSAILGSDWEDGDS